MYENDKSPIPSMSSADSQPNDKTAAAKDICVRLQKLIATETKEGDSKSASKLQDAYDICEEFITEEGNEPQEDGSKEGADQDEHGTGENTSTPGKIIDTSLTLGPMSKLKNYLAQKSVEVQSQI